MEVKESKSWKETKSWLKNERLYLFLAKRNIITKKEGFPNGKEEKKSKTMR